MKVVALYRPKSEHEGMVLDFQRNYKQLRDREFKLISLNTVEGDDMAKLYDITSYPAILALKDDGQLQNIWQGGAWPLMDELDYYASI